MSNVDWQVNGSDDLDAVNQAFGANGEDIKQESLKTIRFLRQAESALDKVHTYINDYNVFA